MILEDIFAPIAEELQLVKKQLRFQLECLYEKQDIHQYYKDSIELFINHFFNTPGKALRPALVLLCAKLTGPVNASEPTYHPLIQLATAMELLHSASLVHDDVLDNAQSRRDQVSLNEKYGNKIAVLVGDVLFLQGFSLLLNLEISDWQVKQEIFQTICRTTQKMCFGEIYQHQILTAHRPAEFDEYLVIVEHKTAILMSACCQCGAMLAGKDKMASQNLANFGFHFGLAFQLADDFKDGDSLLNRDFDIMRTTKAYIEKAKAHLPSANDNIMAKHLMALCDFFSPEN
jgi:octaprenyl-diphosphate synthase